MAVKILIILNYYYPYVSGVSEYARILAENLVKRGHDVSVLTSNHNQLPKREIINGVKVVRADILCKISKGTLSLEFLKLARKLSKEADIINLHLPMLESGWITNFIDKEKIVATYHCDINLPSNILNNFIIKIMDMSNKVCMKHSCKIMVQTLDYAQHSRAAAKFSHKFIETTTPIKEYYRKDIARADKTVIGFCGRLVEEKGIDVLLEAYRMICERRKNCILQIGGDYKSVAGGSIYPQLCDFIEKNHIEGVEFLGKIPEEKMEEFYSSIDIFVLPSINSLEAFGMVQVEAMECGTPVVATDLYGVRTIVQKTGMGIVVKKKDADALARGIIEVLENKEKYIKSREHIRKLYGTDICVSAYENTFYDIADINKDI